MTTREQIKMEAKAKGLSVVEQDFGREMHVVDPATGERVARYVREPGKAMLFDVEEVRVSAVIIS